MGSEIPPSLEKPCTESAIGRGSILVMLRNPIQPTAERPFPLPDCILRDGWWLTGAPLPAVGRRGAWVVTRQEGFSERDRGEGERRHIVART